MKKLLKYLLFRFKFKNSKISFHSQVSANTVIFPFVKVLKNSNIGSCVINKYTYIGKNCDFSYTHIGAFCSIGNGVVCGAADHPINNVSTYPGFYKSKSSGAYSFDSDIEFTDQKETFIGHDVWIGVNTIILAGVNIGTGAVIAAGSVVTKDVLPYSIVGGIPAKIIRSRFEPSLIKSLLDSKWWEKDVNILQKHNHLMDKPLMFIEVIVKGN
tara:strand:- start:2617 stop:3255 length:639 start_codon:yes stop_codon:yes gene_type:complete